MKFGIREICDVVLKAKTAQKVGNKVFYKNEPVLYFDSLKTSSLEGASTTVYAQGGRGNARLIAWEGERTVTFTMEDALISPEGFSILTGAGLVQGEEKPIIMHVTEQTDEVKLFGNSGEITTISDSPTEVLSVQIGLKQKPYFGSTGETSYKFLTLSSADTTIHTTQSSNTSDQQNEIREHLDKLAARGQPLGFTLVYQDDEGIYEDKVNHVNYSAYKHDTNFSEWLSSNNNDTASVYSDDTFSFTKTLAYAYRQTTYGISGTEDFMYVMTMKDGLINSEPFIPSEVSVEELNGLYVVTIAADESSLSGQNNSGTQIINNVSMSRKNNLTEFFTPGCVVFVDYYTARQSGAYQIDITPDKFGGNYYLEASTLFRDTNGTDLPAEFIIPNCKIQSNFTFSMASSGDPSTFTFTMDAFPDYTRWDKTKKVFAAIQVFDVGDVGVDLKRLGTEHNNSAISTEYETYHKPFIEL